MDLTFSAHGKRSGDVRSADIFTKDSRRFGPYGEKLLSRFVHRPSVQEKIIDEPILIQILDEDTKSFRMKRNRYFHDYIFL